MEASETINSASNRQWPKRYSEEKRRRVSIEQKSEDGLSNSWQGRGLVHGDGVHDGPTTIVAVRIVRDGRGPISCSILCHSAAANRVTVEGTVTQLRQRAGGSCSRGIKAENHPTMVSFASQTDRSTDQPIKQATMAFKV